MTAADITLRDLHSALTDLLMIQGAKMVAVLLDKYGVRRIADLPAGRYEEFMDEVRAARGAVTTEETHLDTGDRI